MDMPMSRSLNLRFFLLRRGKSSNLNLARKTLFRKEAHNFMEGLKSLSPFRASACEGQFKINKSIENSFSYFLEERATFAFFTGFNERNKLLQKLQLRHSEIFGDKIRTQGSLLFTSENFKAVKVNLSDIYELGSSSDSEGSSENETDSDYEPKEMERRKKISKANSGKVPWNKGLKWSPGDSVIFLPVFDILIVLLFRRSS